MHHKKTLKYFVDLKPCAENNFYWYGSIKLAKFLLYFYKHSVYYLTFIHYKKLQHDKRQNHRFTWQSNINCIAVNFAKIGLSLCSITQSDTVRHTSSFSPAQSAPNKCSKQVSRASTVNETHFSHHFSLVWLESFRIIILVSMLLWC